MVASFKSWNLRSLKRFEIVDWTELKNSRENSSFHSLNCTYPYTLLFPKQDTDVMLSSHWTLRN